MDPSFFSFNICPSCLCFLRCQSSFCTGASPFSHPRSPDFPLHHPLHEERPHHPHTHLHVCLSSYCSAAGEHITNYKANVFLYASSQLFWFTLSKKKKRKGPYWTNHFFCISVNAVAKSVLMQNPQSLSKRNDSKFE